MEVSEINQTVTDPIEPLMDSADATADAEFTAGYDHASTPVKTPSTDVGVVEASVAEGTPAATEGGIILPNPEQYVQIRKSEWEQILTQSAAVADLKQEMGKRFDTTFGKMGGLERTLTQLQQATPTGEPVVVTEEDLAELRADGFPDLTKSMAAGLTRVLSKLKGTGTSAPIDVLGQVQPFITQALAAQQAEFAKSQEHERRERLTDMHENWQEIAGPKDSQTPYRQWLAQQPNGAQVLHSDNPRDVGKSITAFLTEEKRKAALKPAAGRQQRLAEAVPAHGGNGTTPMKTQPSDDEQFEAGFKQRFRS